MRRGRDTWRNWARTEEVVPRRVVRPRDVGEVSAAVTTAVRDGLRVKAAGSGHSFTGAAVAPGVRLDLAGLARLRRLDAATGEVTVEAGIPLHRLSPLLWDAGLALPNLGDIDRQTLAGAISTGTHGTGLRFGGLASQVTGLELVLADGSVVQCSAGQRPDLFRAAQVGVGAFGVITAVTLQAVPAFGIAAVEGMQPLADVLAGADRLARTHDHFEFFLFPHTKAVQVKANARLAPGATTEPLGRARAFVEDEVLSNGALELVCRAGAAAPRTIPAWNRLCAKVWGGRQYSDRSYRVFASSRRVRFRETEWAVPREALPDVLGEIIGWLDEPGHTVGFPLEVRFGPAEDAWLSTAHGRETAWVAAQTYWRQPHEAYFAAVARIASAYEGRPHWGKLHPLGAEDFRKLYPRFEDAMEVRDSVDPGRVFSNDYVSRVFGA